MSHDAVRDGRGSHGKGFSVLLVDDNLGNLIAVEAELEPLGLEFARARSAEEALRLLLTREFSLFILDVAMPGMDGFELATLIRQREKHRHTPILFLTAQIEPDAIMRGYRLGAADYLEKPVDPVVLQKKVGCYLNLYRELSEAPEVPRASILLVDDNPHNLIALQGALFSLGAELVAVGSGEEALEVIRKQEFALAFVDVRLPGMDGFEVVNRIRQDPRNRETPVILTTALAKASESVERGYGVGAVDYLFSPAEPGILRAKAKVFLELFESRIFARQQEVYTRHIERIEAEKRLVEERLRTREQTMARELEAQKTRSALELAESRAGLLAEMKRLNAQLTTTNQDLEAFAYSVSHDLRAPLRHMEGFLGLLDEHLGGTLDDKSRSYLGKAKASSQRMAQLIEDLLTFSRMTQQKMIRTRLDLNPLVRTVVEELKPETGDRRIEWRLGTLPTVQGDPVLLQAAFMNLLSNALKFTRHKPEAIIEVGFLDDLSTEQRIFIRDNGAGFDPANAHKLFGVFQRLHREDEFEGTGIGLANVHRIIQRHGGRVWADGSPGEGATFYLAFPKETTP